MAIIEEDYVSFETALLLKKKGFEQVGCQKQYNTQGDLCVGYCYGPVAPTLQMAMKWLREAHNLFIQITVDFSDGAYPMYDVCVIDLAKCTSIVINGYNRYSYEEAIKAGIKHCLENLILLRQQ